VRNPTCAGLIAFQKSVGQGDNQDLGIAITGNPSVVCSYREVATRIRDDQSIAASAARRLFPKKLALTGNSLVKFGGFLDPVFKLAVPLGQLPRYYIATTGRAPIHKVCSENDFLTGQKLVLCRWTAFRAHARILTHCKVFAATGYSNDAGYDSKKLSASSVEPPGRQPLSASSARRGFLASCPAYCGAAWACENITCEAPARAVLKAYPNFDFWNPGPLEEQTNRRSGPREVRSQPHQTQESNARYSGAFLGP
jgi:hypothetical protein